MRKVEYLREKLYCSVSSAGSTWEMVSKPSRPGGNIILSSEDISLEEILGRHFGKDGWICFQIDQEKPSKTPENQWAMLYTVRFWRKKSILRNLLEKMCQS